MRKSYVQPVFVGEPIDPQTQSIFLAGPSPRDASHPNWRIKALEILERLKYPGKVYIPLTRDGGWLGQYEEQVHWEWEALGSANVIVFWVPRSDDLPGFTTNIEFGFSAFARPDRVLLGVPKDAKKTRYMVEMGLSIQTLRRRFGFPETSPPMPVHVYGDLEQLLTAAANLSPLIEVEYDGVYYDQQRR